MIAVLEQLITREQERVKFLYEGARYAERQARGGSVIEYELYQAEAQKISAQNREALFRLIEYKKTVLDGFQHKLYRCEWVTEVYTVDEHGFRPINHEVWYEQAWPTREEAVRDLERITVLGTNPNHRTYPAATHSYYDCGVRYREVVCN